MIAAIVISLIVVLILIISICLIYFALKRRFEIKNHKKRVYKVINKYAKENDCYLLNDIYLYYVNDKNAPELIVFDHILFTEKYVLVFYDFATRGGLYGNKNDQELFLQTENGEQKMVKNPLIFNFYQTKKLEMICSVSKEKHLFSTLTVYNSSLLVPSNIQTKNAENSFLPLDELEQTLKKIEKDDVSILSDQDLKKMVMSIKERSTKVKLDVKNKNK